MTPALAHTSHWRTAKSKQPAMYAEMTVQADEHKSCHIRRKQEYYSCFLIICFPEPWNPVPDLLLLATTPLKLAFLSVGKA